ncbi:hypothetical protein P9D54_13230 [Bacillus haynesii]|uniref:hypothetical protein n=1 Tax=Bacillus haynesii TaxID=1925021 RepID=UPI0022817AA5|nr:hypothetical protein [Bacillus haynesii]MCY8663686.1 hypothetical protein [Bacillus haynesii]MEC1346327.1 hypothetical protein [Bacillus haynesii]
MNKEQFTIEIELKGGLKGEKSDEKKRLEKIKESYSNCVDMALSEGETLPYYDIEVSDMNFLIEQAEKGMTVTRSAGNLRTLHECITRMQEIKLICQRAKHHYIEKKDIDDILKLLEGKV